MQNALLTLLIVYWPQVMVVVALCFLLLLYGVYVEPLLVKKGILKERFDEMSREEASKFIDDFIACKHDGPYDIDDFISGKYRDPLITELSIYINGLLGLTLMEKQLNDLQEFKSRLAIAIDD